MDYNKEEYEKPWMEFVKVDTEQSILTLSDDTPESDDTPDFYRSNQDEFD